jgi:hypothetical protein
MKCVKTVKVDNEDFPTVTYLDTSSAVLMSEQGHEPENIMYTINVMKNVEMRNHDVSDDVISHVRTKSIHVSNNIRDDIKHAYYETVKPEKHVKNRKNKASLENDMELMGHVVAATMFGDHVRLISDDSDISKTLTYLYSTDNYEVYSDNIEIYQMRE